MRDPVWRQNKVHLHRYDEKPKYIFPASALFAQRQSPLHL
jgi:hypothetical protein